MIRTDVFEDFGDLFMLPYAQYVGYLKTKYDLKIWSASCVWADQDWIAMESNIYFNILSLI